jgi:hypothetical protein
MPWDVGLEIATVNLAVIADVENGISQHACIVIAIEFHQRHYYAAVITIIRAVSAAGRPLCDLPFFRVNGTRHDPIDERCPLPVVLSSDKCTSQAQSGATKTAVQNGECLIAHALGTRKTDEIAVFTTHCSLS